MPEADCEVIAEAVDRLEQELSFIESRLDTIVNAGLDEMDPLGYFRLQPAADRLLRERAELQDAWHNSMNELAICRSRLSRHETPH
jgi:hypothetical protein